MVDTGWISPATMVNYPRGGSTPAWTDVDEAKTQNDDYADCSLLKNYTTEYLGAQNFTFGIPAGATINGVEIRYEAWSDLTISDQALEETVRLHRGGTQTGDNKADLLDIPNSDTDTYKVIGGAADMWNSGYDFADVTNADFGIIIAFDNNDQNWTDVFHVDHMQIKIYYTPSAGYGNDVNDVPAATIASINDVPVANIETVNDI